MNPEVIAQDAALGLSIAGTIFTVLAVAIAYYMGDNEPRTDRW